MKETEVYKFRDMYEITISPKSPLLLILKMMAR